MHHPHPKLLARGAIALLLVASMAACSAEEAAPAPNGALDATPTAQQPGAEAADVPVDQDPAVAKLAEMGGAMQLMAESCDSGYDQAQLAAMKEQQKRNFVQMGGHEAGFEAAFTAGYDNAKQRYGAASPNERQQICAQAEQLQRLAPQG